MAADVIHANLPGQDEVGDIVNRRALPLQETLLQIFFKVRVNGTSGSEEGDGCAAHNASTDELP